jgi:hypothetical protein
MCVLGRVANEVAKIPVCSDFVFPQKIKNDLNKTKGNPNERT